MNSLITRSLLNDNLFRDLAPGFFIKPLHGDGLPSPERIKMDIKESEQSYVVQAEIPGVSKENIHVAIDNNIVTLRAEIKQEDRQEKEQVLRSERYYGAVSRSFQLAQDIDQGKAKAKYDHGVLTLTLPKKLSTQGSHRLLIE